jgi:hypothetical protein
MARGELWTGLAWSAARMERGMAGRGGGARGARVTGALGGRYRAGVRRGEADESGDRVDGDGRRREFGINGGSSGKDGVNTMGGHRWYSPSYVE